MKGKATFLDKTNHSSDKIISDNIMSIIRLVIAALLAFAGTYFNMPARGLLSTMPVLLLAVLCSVLIKVPVWQKAALFGLFGYLFSALEFDSTTDLYFAALCILLVLACSLAFYLFKKKKIPQMILAIILVFACAVPQIYFFGNYPEAKTANEKLQEYVSIRYSDEEMIISGIHYDYTTGYYKASLYNKTLPTNVYSIAIKNNHLQDSFIPFAEKELTNSKMLEMTQVLRASFENDLFDVTALEISGYPFSGQISLNDTTDYSSLIKYKIIVPGLLNKNEFEQKAKKYFDVIMESGLDFNEIIFVGSGLQADILTITVGRNPLILDFSRLTTPPSNLSIHEAFFGFSE